MACNGLHITVGEALDKLSILLLKKKYAEEDKLDGKRWDGISINMEALNEEINTLCKELEHHFQDMGLVVNLIKMAQANAAIFQLERGLRTCDLQSVDLTKAGRDSVKIRQENAVRVGARNIINLMTERMQETAESCGSLEEALEKVPPEARWMLGQAEGMGS